MTRPAASRLPPGPAGSLALVTVAVYGACYYSYSALIDPIAAATSWSKAALGAVFGGVLLLTGLGAPVAGRILDRRGTRPLFLAAATAGAGALLAASFQTRFAAFAVTYAAGCGIAGALGFYHVTQPTAARMAPADPARAIIWLTIAGAFASPVYLPLTGYLVTAAGWRATIRIDAATLAAAFLIAALFAAGGKASADPAAARGGRAVRKALKAAWRSPPVRVWLLATVTGGAATDAMLTYQVPAMIAAGLSPAAAATITGIRGISQLAGRLPLGRILRRFGARRTIAAASILAAAAAITLLASRQVPAAIAYSLLGGASLGAISALQGIYTQQLVAPQDLGLLFGAQQAAYGAGGALGPALGGALLAATSSFHPVIITIAATFLASAAMLIRSPAPPAPASGDQPAREGPNPPQSERTG
jgi:predicted MFS family arabinose efflux permease